MKIPIILKGDTPQAVQIKLADGSYGDGSRLEVEYRGIVRTFDGLVGGETKLLEFTASETAAFPLGTDAVHVRVVDAGGKVHTVPGEVRIKVTDCPADVYDAEIVVGHTGLSVGDLGAADSIGKVKDVVNEIINYIRIGASVLAVMFGLCIFAAEPKSAELNDIPGNVSIVTNATSAFAPMSHVEDRGNPHGVTARQIGALTPSQTDQIIRSSYWTADFTGAVDRVSRQLGFGDYTFARDVFSDWTPETEPQMGVGNEPSFDEMYKVWIWNDLNGEHYEANGEADSTRLLFVHGLDFGDPFWASRKLVGKTGDKFVGSSAITNFATKKEVADAVAGAGVDPALVGKVDALSDTVAAWQTYWDGDDVRVTVTNYYGSMDIPSLYLEQKMEADGDHAEPWFKVVWDERTRWNRFLTAWDEVTNNVADRAWGLYDSSSGAYSPDGYLQLSQEQVIISSGMSYQKTVTAGCSLWVLKSTSPTTLSGETENGYFRIEDSDGNALFEIVKGDKRIVGATATDVSVTGGSMAIHYNSVSSEHPVLEVCTDLSRADWQREDEATVARVAWSGSSGAWVATVTPVGARPQLFAKASYEAGGNTYIKNHVASSLDKVVVGGTEYTVSVEVVNGKKLLVLR